MARQLTPREESAAVLDAQGHSSNEIASLLGISQRMVVNYRARPEYLELRAELIERGARQVEAMVVRVREKVLDELERSLPTLGAMAREAVDNEGRPAHSTRLKAVQVLAELAREAGLSAPKAQAEAAPAAAAAVLVLERPDRAAQGDVIDTTASDG